MKGDLSDPLVRRDGPDDDGVIVITLDRPDVRNAMNWQAWEQLANAVADLRDYAGAARAVVLTGNGVFCAGGDIRSLGESTSERVVAPTARLQVVHKVIRGIVTARAPVIAAVEGYAIGAGWGLALACDLIVSSEDAYFRAPFAARGLVPDAALGWSLPRIVGRYRANRIVLTGERVDAGMAAELGLVSHVVPPGTALESARNIACELAAGPQDSVALSKALMTTGLDQSLDAYVESELLTAALNTRGRDASEGKLAFTEHREPDFRHAHQ